MINKTEELIRYKIRKGKENSFLKEKIRKVKPTHAPKDWLY